MEGFLRKYGWALQLAFVVLVAILLALITSRLVGVYLAPYRVPDVDISPKKVASNNQAPSRKVPADVMARVINERCLFDGCPEAQAPPDCDPPCPSGQVCSDGTCVTDPAKPTEPETGVPVESTSGVKLLGVIVAGHPRYSRATLKVPSEPVSAIVGIGDTIDGAEIREIYRDRIIISKGSSLEFIRLDESLQGNPTSSRTIGYKGAKTKEARQPPNPNAPSKQKEEDPPVVEAAPSLAELRQKEERQERQGQGGGRRIEIERAELDRALANPAALARDIQIIPHYSNGKPIGVKVRAIKGPFARLGLQPGDVVRKINGSPITTQMSAVQALSNLKNAKSVGIEVERGGNTETLNYTLK